MFLGIGSSELKMLETEFVSCPTNKSIYPWFFCLCLALLYPSDTPPPAPYNHRNRCSKSLGQGIFLRCGPKANAPWPFATTHKLRENDANFLWLWRMWSSMGRKKVTELNEIKRGEVPIFGKNGAIIATIIVEVRCLECGSTAVCSNGSQGRKLRFSQYICKNPECQYLKDKGRHRHFTLSTSQVMKRLADDGMATIIEKVFWEI